MKRWITPLLSNGALVGAVCSVLTASGAFAQDQQEDNGKPKPAAHAPLIDPNEPDTTQDPNALMPDTAPLTRVQSPGLGTVEFRHSYWVPRVRGAPTVQNAGNGGNWYDTTYLAGTLSLSGAGARSQPAVNSSAGRC